MKAVGIRELKNRLSAYVRAVRSGEEILVTDRGEVVAELGPPGRGREPAPYPKLVEYSRAGGVRIGAGNSAAAYPELPAALPEGRASKLLNEERGER